MRKSSITSGALFPFIKKIYTYIHIYIILNFLFPSGLQNNGFTSRSTDGAQFYVHLYGKRDFY